MGLSHSLRRAIASHKAAREAAEKPEPPPKKLTKKQQLQADCTAAGIDWEASWTIKKLQSALK